LSDDLHCSELTDTTQAQVAIVGMSARLPGAKDIPEYWDNLLHGRDVISRIPQDRWDWKSIDGSAADAGFKSYANQGGFISSQDCFDGQFFGFLPKEIQSMDPQQRLFLEASYAALEDAGIAPSSLAGSQTGVFVGVGNADYPVLMRESGVPLDGYRGTGMALTAISNRVSFQLDLRGPSSSIDTACSGSLVAIHRAITALESGDCNLAIVGGVNLILGPELYVAFSKAEMLSPRGRCHTFDDSADGYVRGEGVGALILQRRTDAERAGSHIHAIVRGSAENHGGRAHSFTAPNAEAQADVVRKAWRRSGLNPRSAAFIETHGTGTPLGDPIEINGLNMVITEAEAERSGQDETPIMLSASKSQIGHLEAAAGLASVIKAVLSLRHEWMPQNLHCHQLNKQIEIDRNRFHLATHARPIKRSDGSPLLAGVSSFGFGGVNSHIVLQAPEKTGAPADVGDTQSVNQTEPMLFVLSAKTASALRARASQLIDYVALSSPQAQSQTREVLLDRIAKLLSRALPTEAQSSRDEDFLCIHPQDLAQACESLSDNFKCDIKLRDLRDCLSIGELTDRIARQVTAYHTASQTRTANKGDHQTPAVSDEFPIGLSSEGRLASISYTLLNGRDALPERLAVIATSSDELTDKLQIFLDGTQTADNEIFSGKAKRIRSKDRHAQGIPAPVAQSSRTGTNVHLSEAAKLWVADRGYVLSWTKLHSRRPTPVRVPLPTYPFALERTWFQNPAAQANTVETQDAPHHVDTHAPSAPSLNGHSPTPALADKSAGPEQALHQHGGGPLSSWQLAWKGGRVMPPASLMSLAIMLEAAAQQSPNAFSVEDLTFASPYRSVGASLSCASFVSGEDHIVQCLTRSEPPVPLVQGRLVLAPSIHATRSEPQMTASNDSFEGTTLQADEFYSALATLDMRLASQLQCVTSARGARDRLVMTIALPERRDEPGSFWTALFAAQMTGFLWLEHARNTGRTLFVPKTLDQISVKPERLSQIKMIEIEKIGFMTFQLRCATAAGELVMQAQNLCTGRYSTQHNKRQITPQPATLEGVQ